MDDALKPVRDALAEGDKERAEELLQPFLANPTPEIWYLAANAANSRETAIAYLKQALALDPWYTKADRMLVRLSAQNQSADVDAPSPVPADLPLPDVDDIAPSIDMLIGEQSLDKTVLPTLKKPVRPKRQLGFWARLGCVGGLLVTISGSLLVMNLLGLAVGFTGSLKVALGGATPIRSVDGTPIADIAAPALVVVPEKIQLVDYGQSIIDTLNDGYAHQYEFVATRADNVVIYVQFLSPMSVHASENVAVLDNSGGSAEGLCIREALEGGNSVRFTCEVDQNGSWSVRIFGRENQSIGVYFLSVNRVAG